MQCPKTPSESDRQTATPFGGIGNAVGTISY